VSRYEVGATQVDDKGRTWTVAEWVGGVRYWSDGLGSACPLGSGPEAPEPVRRLQLLPEPGVTTVMFWAPLEGGKFVLVCYCGKGMIGDPSEHAAVCYAYTTEPQVQP
jgi:hypothetical protein